MGKQTVPDEWLLEHLACPRDWERLACEGERLVCPDGHSYPIVEGIPIILREEVGATHGGRQISVEVGAGGPVPRAEFDPADSESIHPVVQVMVGATCGWLYGPLIGKLRRYSIPELRLPASSGEHFLDVGCSWGRWSLAAAHKGYRVVGMDVDIGTVLAARDIVRQLGIAAAFLVADARHLPFEAASFGVTFSYSVLQHLSKADARLAFAEMGRVLRPNGTALVQMPNRYGMRCLYHQLRRGFKEATNFDVRYWTPRELRMAFTEAIGTTELSVDGYFGLGIQKSDLDMLPCRYRLVVRTSELLRKLSLSAPWMLHLADSLYLRGTRSSQPV